MKIAIYLFAGFLTGYIALIISSFAPNFALLLTVSIVTLVLIKPDMLKFHLAFIFSAGLIVDIANQNRFPFEVLFLLAIVLASELLRSRFIEFSNRLISFTYFLIVSILYTTFHFLFYYHAINVATFLNAMLSGLAITVIIFILKGSYKAGL